MGIKEKDLEELILNLLNTSGEVRETIRKICGGGQFSPKETEHDHSDSQRIPLLEAKLNEAETSFRAAKTKVTQLENEISTLKIELTSLNNTIQQKDSEIEKLRLEKCSLEGIIEEENADIDKMKQIIDQLKERFIAPIDLLQKYKTLSSSIRTGLSNIICDENEILFIASCSTSDHLKAIWVYIKKLIGTNGDEREIEILMSIFDYFFDVLNSSLSESMYIRDDVEEGDIFDEDKYDRCTGCPTSGRISQVMLRGYISNNTKKSICRSLVRI